MNLIVRQKVADFVRWRELFDGHLEAQKEAGMELQHLWRNVDDPDEVVLHFKVDNKKEAEEFVYSSEMPDAFNGTNVIDEPDIYFVE